MEYYAGDRRRRDVPGMIDALWHVLEKYELVADDTFLGGYGELITFINNGVDPENPRVEVVVIYDV